jgi:putative endonuclease
MGLVQSIVARLRLSRRVGSTSVPPKTTAAHIDLGQRGEELAARYLRKHGYRVLYRNFRGPRGGEVDLVCRDKKEARLVFVEVKTRASEQYGRPISAVDREKQIFIARGALAWLRMLDDPEVPFRFDVVEVVMDDPTPTITLVQDAFVLPAPYRY